MKRLIIPALIVLTLSACSTYIEKDHKTVLIQDKSVKDTQVYDTQVYDTQVYDTQVYDTQVYDRDRQIYDTDTQVYDRSRSNTNNSNTIIRHEPPNRPAQQDIVNDID